MNPKRYPARNNWRVLIPARFSDTGKHQARFFDSKTEAETEIHRILNRGSSSKPKVSKAEATASRYIKKLEPDIGQAWFAIRPRGMRLPAHSDVFPRFF